jgi:hypothetical protein
LQVNNDSASDSTNSAEDKSKAQKKLVEELKVEWKELWSERINDKVRAEGVSIANYESLRIERGTVIHATRDFKALNFKEILEEHLVENPERYIQPNRHEGGWTKFVKTEITAKQTKKNTRAAEYAPKKPEGKQPKKSGRGWLHST